MKIFTRWILDKYFDDPKMDDLCMLDGFTFKLEEMKVAYKAGMLRAAEIGENGDFSTSYHYSPMDVVRAIKEEAESIK